MKIQYAKKLPAKILEKLVLAFKRLIPEPNKVAIDSTGISLDNASQHYCKRIGLSSKKRAFMKTSFIVDIENYLILLCKTRNVKCQKIDIVLRVVAHNIDRLLKMQKEIILVFIRIWRVSY